MSKLQDFQAAFAADLTTGSQTSLLMLAGDEGQARLRLLVHQRSILAHVVETLGHFFPIVKQQMGRDEFVEVCKRFLAEHPPGSGNMDGYGADFSAFLEGETLQELAALEWAQHACLVAVDEDGLSAEDFAAQIDAVLAKSVLLRSGVEILAFETDALKTWRAAQGMKEAMGTCAYALIVREADFRVGVYVLKDWQYDLLQRAQTLALGDALESLDVAAEDLQQFLALCLTLMVWKKENGNV